MAHVVLIEAMPWDPATGAMVPVRLAGGGCRHYIHKGFVDWLGGVVRLPKVTMEIGFGASGFTDGAVPQTAAINFSPSRADTRTRLARLVWASAPVTISMGDDALDAPEWTVALAGTIAGYSISGGSFTFTLSDMAGNLAKPLASATFAGTSGIEGPTEAAGRVKRRSWGRVFNVEGRILDAASGIYEFGDPAYPIGAFAAVKDRGREGPLVQVAWAGDVASTFAALKAAAVPAGGAAVAPSIACAKWWTIRPAPAPLTADLLGEVGTGYVETVPAIAARIVAAAGGPAVADVAAVDLVRPNAAGIHVDSTSETAAAALDRLLLPASLTWSIDPAGATRLSPIGFDAPVARLRAHSIEREAAYAPVTRVEVGYRRNHRIHSDAEISAAIRSTDVIYEDGTPIEVLKPAEGGATNSADPKSAFGPDGTVSEHLQKVAQLAGAVEILADTPDPEKLFEGVQALVDNIQAQGVAALADQLLGEVRQKRNDALLHLDGVPLGPVVKKVDRTSQERDEVLAESISLVKASGQTTLGLLDAEVFRLEQARISDLGTEATAISSVRADAQMLVDGVARRTTGEIERVEKATGDATKAAASAAEAITARFEIANAENVGGIRRLDAVVATEKDVTATTFAAIEADFDGRVKAQGARTEQVFASEQEARAQALDTLRADMAATIGGEAARYAAETQRLESNIVTGSSAQSTALQSTRAELMLDSEFGRALMSAISRRLDQAVVDEQGARVSSVEQVRAEVSGVAGEVTIQKLALVDLQGRVQAYLVLQVEAGTGRAVVSLQADDIDGSLIDFAANRLRFANPVDGKMITAMQIAGGNVEVVNDLYLGSGCIIQRTATHMSVQGTGFGNKGQFLTWFGPLKSDLSQCTEAEGLAFQTIDGRAYLAKGQSEADLRNTKSNDDYGMTSVSLGPFVTNGKTRQYVVSLTYDASGTRWSTYQDEGPVTGTFILEQLRADGGWDQLGVGQLGGYVYDDGGNGGYASDSEPAAYTKSASGLTEVTDTSGGTDPIQLRARITAFSAPGVTGTAYQQDVVRQLLTVTSYEP